jgi:hypothetical protein
VSLLEQRDGDACPAGRLLGRFRAGRLGDDGEGKARDEGEREGEDS